MSDVYRGVLVLGDTGSGKSTLCNVTTGTTKFGEYAGLDAGTKSPQNEVETVNGKQYRLQDTIGFRDGSLSNRDVMIKVVEGCQGIQQLHQILVIFPLADGCRVSVKHIDSLNLICSTILGEQAKKFVTVIFSFCSYFRDSARCEQEKQKLCNANSKFKQFFDEIPNVLFLNCPPINVTDQALAEQARKDREESQTRVLMRLEQCSEVFQLDPQDQLMARAQGIQPPIEEQKQNARAAIGALNTAVDQAQAAVVQQNAENEAKLNEQEAAIEASKAQQKQQIEDAQKLNKEQEAQQQKQLEEAQNQQSQQDDDDDDDFPCSIL